MGLCLVRARLVSSPKDGDNSDITRGVCPSWMHMISRAGWMTMCASWVPFYAGESQQPDRSSYVPFRVSVVHRRTDMLRLSSS